MRRQRAISNGRNDWRQCCQLVLMGLCLLGHYSTIEAFAGNRARLVTHRSTHHRCDNVVLSSQPFMILAQRSPANPSLQQRAQTTTLASSKDDAASSIGRQVAGQSSNSSSGSGGIIKETQLHSPSAHLPSMFETGGSTNTAAAAVANNTTEDIYAQAIERTLLWVGAALLFGTGLWVMVGPTTAEEFFAGYLVEQSLSVDNLFVFLVLFEYFRVPLSSQGRVLNWGIFGAIIMRSIMIGLGAAALQHFHELLLLFAAILIYSSANSLISLAAGPDEGEDEEDLSQNAIVKFSRSLIPSTDRFDGDRFFTVVDGIKKATPLFICMIAVEVSDVVFAVDSIPAVFGVTENPLVVFSSNMFAIMGLRSLYTILSKAATDLKYLEPAVAVVLGFIGGKMVAEYLGYHIPTEVALSVVTSMLATGVGASVWEQQQQLKQEEEDAAAAKNARGNGDDEETI